MNIVTDRYALHRGDCVEIMRNFPANTFDSLVTDPPSGISFMGKTWDNHSRYDAQTERGWRALDALRLLELERWAAGFVAFTVDWAVEALRVLKPGAMGLVWALPRTSDLTGLGLRLAGFEVRDNIYHIFGCLSEDTEILINGEWKRYAEISAGDLALTYDLETDCFQWQPIQQVYIYDYSDTAYRIKSDSTDQLVSRNHRCIIERGGSQVFQYAETLQRKESVPILEDLPTLLKALPVPESHPGQTKQVLQPGLHGRGTQGRKDGKTDETSGYLSALQAGILPAHACPGESDLLQPVLQGQSERSTFDTLCEQWEGQAQTGQGTTGYSQPGLEGRRNLLSQTWQLQADQVHSLPVRISSNGAQGWLCNGAQANCSPTPGARFTEDRSSAPQGSRSTQQRSCKSLSVCHQPGSQTVRASRFTCSNLATVTPVHYAGKVWCIRVPTGAFVARRNGKIFVTGNSGFPKSMDISKAIDKAAGAEREVVGKDENRARRQPNGLSTSGRSSYHLGGNSYIGNHNITAPATDAATLWDGWGTALKPAVEEWILVMKPLEGTYAANALAWGVAGINVDGCRIGNEPIKTQAKTPRQSVAGTATPDSTGSHKWNGCDESLPAGRFPAHLLLSDHAAALLDEQSGESKGGGKEGLSGFGRQSSIGGKHGAYNGGVGLPTYSYGDTGGASRYFTVLPTDDQPPFFYTAKSSTSEKNAGLADHAPAQRDASRNAEQPSMHGGEGNPYNRGAAPVANSHPTVKSLALMRWLVRVLATPTGGSVLDPFGGSGSTGIACMAEGRTVTMCERSPEYYEIMRYRMAHWEDELSTAPRHVKGKAGDFADMPLFQERI